MKQRVFDNSHSEQTFLCALVTLSWTMKASLPSGPPQISHTFVPAAGETVQHKIPSAKRPSLRPSRYAPVREPEADVGLRARFNDLTTQRFNDLTTQRFNLRLDRRRIYAVLRQQLLRLPR